MVPLNCPLSFLSVVQGYHELYELQRGRLEAQLLQMTEERDCWSQLTFCLALKVCQLCMLFFCFQLDSPFVLVSFNGGMLLC